METNPELICKKPGYCTEGVYNRLILCLQSVHDLIGFGFPAGSTAQCIDQNKTKYGSVRISPLIGFWIGASCLKLGDARCH